MLIIIIIIIISSIINHMSSLTQLALWFSLIGSDVLLLDLQRVSSPINLHQHPIPSSSLTVGAINHIISLGTVSTSVLRLSSIALVSVLVSKVDSPYKMLLCTVCSMHVICLMTAYSTHQIMLYYTILYYTVYTILY